MNEFQYIFQSPKKILNQLNQNQVEKKKPAKKMTIVVFRGTAKQLSKFLKLKKTAAKVEKAKTEFASIT